MTILAPLLATLMVLTACVPHEEMRAPEKSSATTEGRVGGLGANSGGVSASAATVSAQGAASGGGSGTSSTGKSVGAGPSSSASGSAQGTTAPSSLASSGASALALVREAVTASGGDKVAASATGLRAEGQLKLFTDPVRVLSVSARWRGPEASWFESRDGDALEHRERLTRRAAAQTEGDHPERPLTGADAEDAKLRLAFGYPQVLLLPARKDLLLIGPDDELMKDGTRSGLPASVVEVRRASDGAVLGRLFFDRKTHLPAGYTRKLPDGTQELVRWLEFQDVEGLQFPMKTRTLIAGRAVSELTWDEVTPASLPDSEFEPGVH